MTAVAIVTTQVLTSCSLEVKVSVDTAPGRPSLGAGHYQSTWRGDQLWYRAVERAVGGAEGRGSMGEPSLVLVTDMGHPCLCRDTECRVSDLPLICPFRVSLTG